MSNSGKTSNKRTLVGFVVSDKNDKTIVVRVETLVKHPVLKKYIRRRKKFMAHDPNNECHIGDKVQMPILPPPERAEELASGQNH